MPRPKPAADTVVIRLDWGQIRLVRQLISEKSFMTRKYPMPEDGDLLQRLYALDKPFHFASQLLDDPELPR
jgi:hypothetical protein